MRLWLPLIVLAILLGISATPALAAPVPVVTLGGLGPTFIGSTFDFTVTFDNSDLDETGYGPFIDLYFPARGGDLDGDGITFNSATYLGTALAAGDVTVQTFPAGGCVNHPYQVNNLNQPIQVCGAVGDQLVTIRLPFGSFAPDQPAATVDISATLSNLANFGTDLSVRARGGFQFGADPLENPCCDGAIVTQPASPATSWNPSAPVTPTVIEVEKVYNGPESETATGPNFPRSYTITATIAPGQTFNNLVLTDYIDDNIRVTSVTAVSPAGTVAPVTPFGPVNGGSVAVTYPTVVGGTATFTINFFVPLVDANTTPVIPADSGNDNTTENRVRGDGNWDPIDADDPLTPITVNGSCPGCPPAHVLEDQSIAIQKSVATSGGFLNSGDQVTYTLSFQISDFFAFQNVVITDILSDGQRFDASFTPTLTVNGHNNTSSGNFNAANFTVNPFSGVNGTQTLVFRVSDELVSDGSDNQILGGCIPTTGVATPDCTAFNGGATTGTITYRAIIQDEFDVTFPSGDRSVDHGDILTNNVTIVGDVLNTATLAPTGQTEDDDSGTELTISQGDLVKSIYAINGVTGSYPSGVDIQPGDEITFRLVYRMPSSDFEDFTITDYLPLPIFDATEVTVFNPTIDNTVPPAGEAKFGDTVPALYTVPGFPAARPIMTTDPISNAIEFDFGTFDSATNPDTFVDILFTVTVGNEIFADGLYLTNQARAFEDSTNGSTEPTDAIIQMRLREPFLRITKGVIGSDTPTATFNPDPPFPAGFPANIGSNDLATTPVDSDADGVDAGDLVDFAIVLENRGGRGAFDIRITDLIPPEYIIPAGFTLTITRGDGTTILFDSTGSFGVNDPRNLFTNVSGGFIELRDPGPANPACPQGHPNDGSNVIIIRYSLQTSTAVSAGQTLVNTANVTQYSNEDGNGPTPGGNFVTDPNLYEDDARVRIASTPEKSLISTSEGHTPETGNGTTTALARPVVVGEIVRFRLQMRVPESTTNGLVFRDNIPNGMQFLDDNSARIVFVSNGGGITSTTISDTDSFATGTAPITPPAGSEIPAAAISGGTGDGVDVSFNMGTVTNIDSDADTEWVVIEYNAVVTNVASNQSGTNLANNFTLVVNGVDGATSPNIFVSVVEPAPTMTKSAPSVATGDAYDTFSYTLNVSNPAGGVTAFNLRVTDVLDPALEIVSITAAGWTDATVGNNVDLTLASLNAGASAPITLNLRVRNTIAPGQVVNNSAALTWTSLPGDNGTTGNPTGSTAPGTPSTPTGERTGGGGVNDYTLTANAPTAFTATQITPVKSITATSETASAGNNVLIGEVVRYRLSMQIPEGTMDNFTVVDTFSTGVSVHPSSPIFVTFQRAGGGVDITSSILSSAENTAANTAAAPLILTGIPLTTGVSQVGQTITFNLGTVVNDNNSNGSTEFVIIEFNALVENAAGNAVGMALLNDFDVTTGTGPTQRTVSSNTVSSTVLEPNLTLVKTIVGTPTDAGDTFTYQITVTNATGVNIAPAFDIRVTDTLNPDLDLTGVTVSVAATDNSNLATDTVDVTVGQLNPGASFTVDLTVTIRATVGDGETLNNSATATYTSLPGTNGTTSNPTGSTTPGTPGSGTGERDGSLTPAHNDLTTTGNAPAIIMPSLLAVKSINGTSETHTSGANVAIGEIVDYQLAVTIPEGTSSGVVIFDQLSTGVAPLLNDTMVLRFTNAASGLDSSALNAGQNASANTAGGLALFDAGGVAQTPAIVYNAGSNQLTLNLGTVVNDDSDNANAEQIILNFRVVVLNSAANNIGAILSNSFTVDTDNIVTPVVSNVVPVTVNEPNLTVVKTASPTTGDAGDPITFTVVVSNPAVANASTAFDVIVTDIVPARYGTPVVSSIVPAAGTSSSVTGSTVTVNISSIPVGGTVTITYTASIDIGVIPGETITNTATGTWTSLPGTQGTGNQTPGNSGDNNGERNGSTTPAQNDHTTNDNAVVTVSGSTAEKSIIATGATHTPETGDGTSSAQARQVTIGEEITYRLVTAIPEGTTPNLFLRDVLVNGIEYVPNSARISFVGGNLTSNEIGSVGSSIPPTTIMPAGQINWNAGTRTLSFDFGTMLNGENDAAAEQVVLEFTVVVMDEAINNLGDIYANDFDVEINGAPAGTSTEAFIRLVEPTPTVVKTFIPTSGTINDVVRVQLVISNPAGANASAMFNAVLTDQFDSSLFTNITNATSPMPAGWTFNASTTAGITTVTFQQTGDTPILPGDTLTFLIDIRLTPGVDAGALIPNTATLTATSMPGTPAEEREYTDTDTANLTVLSPDLAITKTHVGSFTVGQNGTFTITVRNVSTNAYATDLITVTDTLTSELTFISATGAGWTCTNNLPTVPTTVTCTRPGPLAPGATAPAITVTVNPNTAVGSPFTNTAVVSTPGDLGPGGNNSDDDIVTVTPTPAPDLTITKQHTGNFTVGVNGTYTIRVQNIGTLATAGTVTVTDNLPTDLTFISASGSSWACGFAAGMVTCTTSDSIAAGAFAPNITLIVRPTAALNGQTFINTANVAYTPSGGNPVESDTGNNSAPDPTVVNSSSAPDLNIVKTHTGSFAAGVNNTFTLTVTNIGTGPTTGTITVTDALPAGMTFVSGTGTIGATAWNCSAVVQNVTCTNTAVLTSGASTAITLTVTPTSAGSFTNTAIVSTPGDNNTGNNSDDDSVLVTSSAAPDLTIAKTHTGNFVVGTPGTFTITVTNIGSAATNGTITVSDTLPAGMTFNTFTGNIGGTAWTCGAAGQVVTCTNTASLGVGASGFIDLTVNVAAGAAGTRINNVAVSYTPTGGQPVETSTTNNTATDSVITTTGGAPDLTIVKSHSGGNFALGVASDFTITVTNIGSLDTSGTITVTDNVPAALQVTGVNGGVFWSCSNVGQLVTCTTSSVIAQSASAPDITINVVPQTAAGTPFTNTATVAYTPTGGTPADSNPNNNSDSDQVGVDNVGQPDLAIDKSHVSNFVVGTNGVWTLRISNVGGLATTGTITVSDTLPGGIGFLTGTGSIGATAWTCSAAGQVVTCQNTAALAPAAFSDITLTVSVSAGAIGVIPNTATVSTPGDTNPSNNSDTDNTTVQSTAEPDLAITKTHPGDFIANNPTPYTYTLTVRNVGGVAAVGAIQVTDSVPNLVSVQAVNTTSPGWTCGNVGNDVTCNFSGTFAQNATATFNISVLAGGSAASFDNIAVVNFTPTGGNPADNNPANNQAVDPTVINGPALFDPPFGLKTVDASGLPILRWGMVWWNLTNTPAFNVRITDVIPTGLDFIPGSLQCQSPSLATTTTLCIYDATTRTVIWEGSIGQEPAPCSGADCDNRLEITFETNVQSGVTQANNTAFANYDADDDGSIIDDLAVGQTPIPVSASWNPSGGAAAIGYVDPAISKRVDPFLADPGEEVTWTVTVFNPGAAPYNNVVITDEIAPQFEILNTTTSAGTVTVSGQQFTLTAPVLNPGETITVVIRTRMRGNPLPAPFYPNQGELAMCSPGGPLYVDNTACVTFDGAPQPFCATANVICSVQELPATGETSSLRPLALAALIGLLALLGIGGVVMVRRRTAG